MLLLRGAYAATADVAAGHWPRGALSNGREIAGKTLGLVGFGGIGRLTGRLGAGARHAGDRLRSAGAAGVVDLDRRRDDAAHAGRRRRARRTSLRCTCR